jgi:hypothetical protein
MHLSMLKGKSNKIFTSGQASRSTILAVLWAADYTYRVFSDVEGYL